MSQPLCAAKDIAPFSISSSFTLICWEILLTDTHCECLPPARSYTPLHKRRARGSYERDGALESRVAMAEFNAFDKSARQLVSVSCLHHWPLVMRLVALEGR